MKPVNCLNTKPCPKNDTGRKGISPGEQKNEGRETTPKTVVDNCGAAVGKRVFETLV
jgi:hypothetical protein